MTVAAVVFEGATSATRLHERVMKDLNPKYLQLVKELKKQRGKLPSMHFVDLTESAKSIVGERLAMANVSVFSASFWYESTTIEHNERFSIYTQLVKIVITAAFQKHQEMEIAIAKQGGWQDYERELLSELKQIPKEMSQQGSFRKGEIYLTSAAKAGIQIADFYVGCIRDYHRDMPDVHEHVKHQVLTYAVYRLPAKKRGDHF
jgi:hypothetical protein